MIRRIGPYRLGEKLGAGGMGAVYRGFDERLGRPVALKQILPEAVGNPRARKRFRREARSAARLSHPGIVKVHDLVEAEGCDWIVMELVEGQPLAEIVRNGPLPLDRAFAIAAEIAEALAVAHADGIVHRDLKALNILIASGPSTAPGRAKILDFGLAKQVVHRDGQSTSITHEGQRVGTPQAMSPEQAMGGKVDLRSDLFSLGALLYEMVTGEAPFRAESSLSSIARVCTYHPPALRERMPRIPRAFSDLVDDLLAKDPDDRPRNAGEVALKLRRILEGLPRGQWLEDGAGLSSGAATEEDERAEPAEGEPRRSERRQVTVMCCELAVADASSDSLDPETSYAATAAFESIAREVIEQFEGHVANALGHRLVAYFGYPRAQEDAARRAVRAARELRKRFVACPAAAGEPRELAVQVGVHSGPTVVLGDLGGGQLALGETLDLAMALQRSAEPGEILVSETVGRLIKASDAVEEVPSISPETAAFRLLDLGSVGPWQIAATPLVARRQEIEILLDRFDRVRQGAGQVVLLSGEAGIGKSRIVGALEERLRSAEVTWLVAKGSPFTESSPLQPIIDLLLGHFGFVPDIDQSRTVMTDVSLESFEEALSLYGLRPDEAAPLLAALLALPAEGRYPPLEITPQKQRELTLQTVADLFLGIASGQPSVLVVEDLHWIDPSTLDLLGRMIDRGASSRLMLFLTFRPEFEARWGSPDHLTQLNLRRLTASEAELLIDRVAQGKSLPVEVREQIVAKTDGIPLFVEELTKNLIESSLLTEGKDGYEVVGSLDSMAIPATLRDSLMARLDRLGPAKEVAQLAATIGREFTYRILAAVSPLAERELGHELDQLVESELVYRKGFSSRQRYLFKHALIQDAAYDSLLKGQRQTNHRSIADVLEADFPKLVENQPEVLAHHYTEAGLPEQGATYWLRAGRRTFRSSAIVEAKKYLEKGLVTTEAVSGGPSRRSQEAEIHLTLAEVLTNLEGMASPRAKQAFEKAIDSAQRDGDKSKTFWSVLGLWRSCVTQGKYDEGMHHAERLQSLVVPEDPIPAIMAKNTIGVSHYFLGEHIAAGRFLQEALDLDDFQRTDPRIGPYIGEDPGVVNLHFYSVNAWILGYPDKAQALTTRAVELAERLSHQYSLTYIMTGFAMLSQFLRSPEQTLEKSELAIALSTKQGSWWRTMAAIYHNWAAALLDHEHAKEHVQTLRESIDVFNSIGMVAQTSKLLAILADAALRNGLVEIASTALDQAVVIMENTGEGHFEAEVFRLRGECALLSAPGPDPDELRRAESEFSRALESARRRHAKSLELRAAVSMGRLLMKSNRHGEAQQLIAEVYDWFTEGFDTVDLEEAKLLLDELGGQRSRRPGAVSRLRSRT